jgi:sugar phosphate isomerase/epimerase
MKISIAVSPNLGEFSPIPFVGKFSESFPIIADLGFDSIEFHVCSPDEVPEKEVNQLLSKNNLSVTAFAPGKAYIQEGLSFIDPDPSIRDAAVNRINAFSLRASSLGAHVFVGFVRGKVSLNPEKRIKDIDLMAKTCRKCCEFAEPLGVKILWEPINRYEMADFNTVDQAIDFLNLVDMPNLQLLLDTFHMNIEEPSILNSIYKSSGRAPYIHVVDNNRMAPGFGHIDFDAIAQVLRDIHFNGVISAEILPLPDPVTAARQAIKIYRRMKSIILPL